MTAQAGNVQRMITGELRIVEDEETFIRSIALERRRAERANRLLVLMLLEIRHAAVGLRPLTSEALIESLGVFVRESDIIGWHERERTIGILFTEITSEHRDSIKGAMMQRISGVLYRNLPFHQFNQAGISCYVFPEEWNHDVPLRPSSPVLYPDLERRESASRAFRIAKRAVDIAASALVLIFLAWAFFLIAMLVKWSSPGPVFFRQVRVGQYGAPFVFLKFRSMYANNDAAIHQKYMADVIKGRAEQHTAAGDGRPVYKLAQDPRVTRIGAFLRKTSLDELPQLLNVLRGEMSLVGPRPAIPYEVQTYQPWHRHRIMGAKPGMTGLWQVSGRNRLSFDEMVRLDVQYAMSRTLSLDLKILIKTPRAVILGDGAC
jgi:lipopolysaccharide/colanic/teichoic acid biosynthesis glycosyltransferase